MFLGKGQKPKEREQKIPLERARRKETYIISRCGIFANSGGSSPDKLLLSNKLPKRKGFNFNKKSNNIIGCK